MSHIPVVASVAVRLDLSVLSAEDVEAIDEMYEEITVDAVEPGITSHLRCDAAADTVLLVEQVIELNAEGGALVEEGLRQLQVPYQFIGIHAGIIVSASAVHGHIGGDAGIPRGGILQTGTIIETVSLHVGLCLETALGLVVHDMSEQAGFKQIPAIGSSEELSEVQVFHCIASAVVCAYTDVAYIVCKRYESGGIAGKGIVLAISSVVAHETIDVPIAVNVFRPTGTCPRSFVVCDSGTDTVGGLCEVDIGKSALLMLFLVGIEVQSEIVAPGRFESRVSFGNVEGVTVVSNIQKVCHGWL